MNFRRLLLSLFILILASVTLVACGDPEPQTPAVTKENTTVEISNLKFSPNAVTIKAGEKVVWKVRDKQEYGLRLDGVFNQTLSAGETFEHTFDKAGTYKVYDVVSPGKIEIVVIVE